MKINKLRCAFRLYPSDLKSQMVILMDWLFNQKRFENRMNLERRFMASEFAGR